MLDRPPRLRELLPDVLRRARSQPQGSIPEGRDLPALRVVLGPTAIDPAKASAYARSCGARYDGRALPPVFPESLFLPLLMQVAVHPDFPLSPLGLIHTAQRFVSHRPLRTHERPRLEAWLASAQADDRGVRIVAGMSVEVDGERVWEGEGEMLSRSPRPKSARTHADKPVPPSQGIALHAPADIGRRFARATGDFNPHHLWPGTARLLGFERPIAHGMWTLARIFALLDERLPRGGPVRADVRFKVPLFLPGDAILLAGAPGGATPGIPIQLLRPETGAPHLVGTIGHP